MCFSRLFISSRTVPHFITQFIFPQIGFFYPPLYTYIGHFIVRLGIRGLLHMSASHLLSSDVFRVPYQRRWHGHHLLEKICT